MTDNKSIQACVSQVEAERGYINLLINNAGIALNPLPSPVPKDLKELQSVLWNTSVEDFDQNFQLNVRSTYYVTVAFLHLLDAGNAKTLEISGVTSQVITIGSMTGYRRDDKVYSIAYVASKAAELHLGKVLCGFLKDHQIRSNVICPGLFPSGKSIHMLNILTNRSNRASRWLYYARDSTDSHPTQTNRQRRRYGRDGLVLGQQSG